MSGTWVTANMRILLHSLHGNSVKVGRFITSADQVSQNYHDTLSTSEQSVLSHHDDYRSASNPSFVSTPNSLLSILFGRTELKICMAPEHTVSERALSKIRIFGLIKQYTCQLHKLYTFSKVALPLKNIVPPPYEEAILDADAILIEYSQIWWSHPSFRQGRQANLETVRTLRRFD